MLKRYYIKEAVPRLYRICTVYHRQRAEESALLTTIAILRYKADKGRLPESLSQLIKTGYVGKLPTDPYSDGPLAYKRTGEDFTLYSLGADFDDDGGLPSSWGQWQEGGDQVFWPLERPSTN